MVTYGLMFWSLRKAWEDTADYAHPLLKSGGNRKGREMLCMLYTLLY